VTTATNTGRIIASYGRRVTVESASGERIVCKVAGRRLEVVCGDEVTWESTDGEGLVTDRLPRRTALARTDSVGRPEVIVANITQMVVVLAPKPAPDFFIMDRYVAAAELSGVRTALVLNKADLVDESFSGSREELAVLERIGYPVLESSASQALGIDALANLLKDHTSILVGQSGTGKSSLANRLLPDLNTATSELSRSSAEGKHTTTVSTLHHLPSGGDLIDSPGVRDFAPAIELLEHPELGFREFTTLPTRCKFQDCKHLREPGCVVLAAVASGDINQRRHESYKRLMRLKKELTPEPGRKPDKRS
jgi:ribosome biogenesis GTPase